MLDMININDTKKNKQKMRENDSRRGIGKISEKIIEKTNDKGVKKISEKKNKKMVNSKMNCMLTVIITLHRIHII